MIPAGPVFHKPKSFIAAKNLLYASIFLSVIALALRIFSLGSLSNSAWKALLATFFGVVIMIMLIKQMSLCKKWPRTVITVWYALVIISVPITMMAGYRMDIPQASIFALQALLQMIAFIFLYSKECNNWFNSTKHEIFEK